MPFKKGDYVKTKGDKPEYGTVTEDEAGGQVKYITAWRERKTAAASDLEANEGIGAFVRSEAPDITEVLANGAVFSVQEKFLGRGFMSAQMMRFIIEDAVYEFVLKGYAKDYVPLTVEPLTGADMDGWVSQQDFMDAGNKAIVIELLDVAYKLVSGKKVGTADMWYFLKCISAMSVANIGQRFMQQKGASYSPQ